jgi:ABC-2 type transport system ATP-binding protein
VVEAVELDASMYPDQADPGELPELLKLSDRARVRYGTLSGGEQQRLSIALALVGRPQVAVLDESTAELDPQARRDTWTVVEQVRDRGVTVVLVTHLMDEAERLCDPLALLDGGRIVALDSPAGLVASVVGQQRLRFRPSTALDGRVLEELDEVVEVRRRNHEVVVTGTGNLVQAVMVRLEHAGVSPEGLQVSQHRLEDVFMALTGRPLAAHRRSEVAR